MTQGVFEIFKNAASQPEEAGKVAYLQQLGNNNAVRTILQGCFHPAVQFALPGDLPPYSEGDPVSVETRMYSMIKRFDIFVHGGRPVSSQAKREMIFIETLESVHPEDAKVMIQMVKKRDPYPGITEAVTRAAFPDLLPPVDIAEEMKATMVKPELEVKRVDNNNPQFNLDPDVPLMPEGQAAELLAATEAVEGSLTPLGEALQTDPTLLEAYNLLQGEKKVGNSFLQKGMGVSFAKATKIFERLEEVGAVGKKGAGGKRMVKVDAK